MHMMNKEKYKRLRESVNMGLNKEYERISGCPKEMTNDEYRIELRKLFDNVNENYKLRWFYLFVSEKLRSSKN